MNILVIARSAWRNDNSTGRTLTDFFSDFTEDNIYSISLRDNVPDNNISLCNLSISEIQQIRHLFNKGEVGIISNRNATIISHSDDLVYKKAKSTNCIIFNFIREWLWALGLWKNKNLENYLKIVNPDVIFMPVYPCWYAHRLLKYIESRTKSKVVIFHADDTYTLKQFSISPLFWIYRIIQRKWIRSTVQLADLQYVISEVQKGDYDRCFGRNHKILTKFSDFDKDLILKKGYNKPLEFIFTGNINLNRWKSLAMIAQAIRIVNIDSPRAILKIYSSTPISKKIDLALNIPGVSMFCGSVSSSEVGLVQENADVLIHVEAFDKKNKCIVRQSFSTKIVDYLAMARPILAVGPVDVASIAHLKKNNAALVASTEKEVLDAVFQLVNDYSILNRMSIAAYECGRLHHNKKNVLNMLQTDIHSLKQ